LILGATEVLDYLVAHEVSHLREMNHGAHSWAHVVRAVSAIQNPFNNGCGQRNQLWRYGLKRLIRSGNSFHVGSSDKFRGRRGEGNQGLVVEMAGIGKGLGQRWQ